jgi:flagellar biosynthesis/type III secretory pathway protein FliH
MTSSKARDSSGWRADPQLARPRALNGFAMAAWHSQLHHEFQVLEVQPLPSAPDQAAEMLQPSPVPAMSPGLLEADAPGAAAPGPDPLQALLEQAQTQARAEGYAQGVADGRRQALAESAARLAPQQDEHAAQQLLLQQQRHREALHIEVLQSLSELVRDPNRLHLPLKRLALHLAEQIVRGELSRGSETARRLVDQALQSLGPGLGQVVVRMNPDDLALLQSSDLGLGDQVQLQAAEHLSRGSIEAFSHDTLIQDSLRDRVAALAGKLFDACDEPAVSP